MALPPLPVFRMASSSSSPSLHPLLSTPPDASTTILSESSDSHRSATLLTDGSPSVLESAPVFPIDRDDAEHGFARPGMYKGALVGTVQLYERHVFLCYKDPHSWPPRVDAAEFDRLPRFLAAALKARKNDLPKKTRLTICEGRDGTDSSNGDVLIFPDMIRYKGLTHFDVDTFVDEVLIHNREWPSGKPERLAGAHVFICCHASRDARCGVCGPVLVQTFKEEIAARGLEGCVFVRPCSHIGGHKYAGNVIIYSSNETDTVGGHWYGYVTPDDVPFLLNEHICKGEILDRLWRGQMGLMEDQQKQAQESRLRSRLDSYSALQKDGKIGCPCSTVQEQVNGHINQETTGRCCQETEEDDKQRAHMGRKKSSENFVVRRRFHGDNLGSGWSQFSSWFESWEREDTLAVLTVVGAAATVAVAYHLYRNMSQN